ncbi:T9SS type A sorting domain-containing protein [candidate division KSB1 bacterium]|nr:T9SS type A sorting domain-containing protein [candidate division KSB1 bacterium]
MKTLSKLVFCVVIYSTLFPENLNALGHQDWSCNLAIYEVNVRQYTKEGTFAAFETHLDRLKEMGVGILWFMPIHPIGEKNRLGSLGSYYSVRDYLDVNPEFGSMENFRDLVREIHSRNMYVMIDWVANHTSWDNPLTVEHPEWYSKDIDGHFIPPPGTNWSDVIQLDYSQQGLREYMIQAMNFWITDVGIDGFRCDAVDFIPKDFWHDAINRLKKVRSDIFMLAEGDTREWHDVGFDMTYSWGFYGFGGGVLKRLADGSATANDLFSFYKAEVSKYAGAYRMYFTSNHDENSWYGTTEELFGDAAGAFAVLTATWNGMPLIYSGQEAGLNKRLLFFEKDQIEWREHENASIYKALLLLKMDNPALWNGEKGGALRRISTAHDTDTFVFVREKDRKRVLVVLNLSGRAQHMTFNDLSLCGFYRNVLTGENIKIEGTGDFQLSAWGYAVYEFIALNGILEQNGIPVGFVVGQNYPNPFHPVTAIDYRLAAPANVEMRVFDVLGREVQTISVGRQQADSYRIVFNAAGLPEGVYFYQFRAGNHTQTRKFVVLR